MLLHSWFVAWVFLIGTNQLIVAHLVTPAFLLFVVACRIARRIGRRLLRWGFCSAVIIGMVWLVPWSFRAQHTGWWVLINWLTPVAIMMVGIWWGTRRMPGGRVSWLSRGIRLVTLAWWSTFLMAYMGFKHDDSLLMIVADVHRILLVLLLILLAGYARWAARRLPSSALSRFCLAIIVAGALTMLVVLLSVNLVWVGWLPMWLWPGWWFVIVGVYGAPVGLSAIGMALIAAALMLRTDVRRVHRAMWDEPRTLSEGL